MNEWGVNSFLMGWCSMEFNSFSFVRFKLNFEGSGCDGVGD